MTLGPNDPLQPSFQPPAAPPPPLAPPPPPTGYPPTTYPPAPGGYGYPPPPFIPQYASPGGYAMTYASARPRARVVLGLTWAVVALNLLMIVPQAIEIPALRRLAAGEPPPDEVTPGQIGLMAVGGLLMLATIAAVVFWMMWVHRAYRNLPALGARDLKYTPGWAVGYYFIPVMNLFRPLQVMWETWRASDPRPAGAVPALIGWWWAFHLVSGVVGQLSFRIGMRSEDVDVLLALAWVDLALCGWDAATAFMEILIVSRLTNLQDERAATATAFPLAGYAAPPPSAGHPYAYPSGVYLPAR